MYNIVYFVDKPWEFTITSKITNGESHDSNIDFYYLFISICWTLK